jgi:hypothetical protein
VSLSRLVTYTLSPLGLTATANGALPAAIVGVLMGLSAPPVAIAYW